MTAPALVRDDNPRWVALLGTALPVVLAALWVWSLPNRAPPGAGPREPYPAPVVAWTTEAEPKGTARTP